MGRKRKTTTTKVLSLTSNYKFELLYPLITKVEIAFYLYLIQVVKPQEEFILDSIFVNKFIKYAKEMGSKEFVESGIYRTVNVLIAENIIVKLNGKLCKLNV